MILTITFHLHTIKPLIKIYNPEKKSLITTQLPIKTFTCIIYTSQYIIYISKIYKSLSQNQHRFTLSHTLAGTPLFDFQLQANHLLKNLPSLKNPRFHHVCSTCRYGVLTPSRVTATIISVWLISAMTVVLQSSLDVGPDFCRRRFTGIAMEQIIGATFLVGLPTLTTIFLYVKLVIRVRHATRGSYKPPIAFSWDYELAKANIYSCVMFVVFWLPFGIVVCLNSFKPISPRVLYNLAWFALSKSCFNNLIYCVADRHFRSAYVKLFHYCCCKTTVSFSRRTRGEGGRNTSDVRLRVHIIHSYASPGSCRPPVGRPNGRDVYEL